MDGVISSGFSGRENEMDAIALFQDHFGLKGVGVKFYKEDIDPGNFQVLRNVRFCEAVRLARDERVYLDKDSIVCKGARYALGFEEEAKEEIVHAIKLKRGLTKDIAVELVDHIPRIKDSPFTFIGLNVDDPDILIFYITPRRFMEFLKVYQRSGNGLEVKLSSLAAMCGDVAVQTFLTKKICISFGCDDSREFGEVADEEMVVGIAKEGIEQLIQSIY